VVPDWYELAEMDMVIDPDLPIAIVCPVVGSVEFIKLA